MDPVLGALNHARAVCFSDPDKPHDQSTTAGAVKGESNRLDVAGALNGVWDAYLSVCRTFDVREPLEISESQAAGMALASDPEVVGPEFASDPRRTDVLFERPEDMPRKGQEVSVKVGEHGVARARVVKLAATVELLDKLGEGEEPYSMDRSFEVAPTWRSDS